MIFQQVLMIFLNQFLFLIFLDFNDFLVKNHENRLFPIRDHKMNSFWTKSGDNTHSDDHFFEPWFSRHYSESKVTRSMRIAYWFRVKPCSKPGPEHLGSEGYPLHNLLKITWFSSWNAQEPDKWPPELKILTFSWKKLKKSWKKWKFLSFFDYFFDFRKNIKKSENFEKI